MKRQTQTTGVRTYFGEDLIGLQAEPLKALDAFFKQYGPCIVQGCEVTDKEDGTVDIAAGLVALDTTDSGVIVMPFAGASGVVFPLYMFAQTEAVERPYDDGEVKPVAYDYTAQVSALPPADGVPSLALSGIDGQRFVDVVQDAGHRFITDAERTKWNGILQLAKEYADATAGTKAAAALETAKEYTDDLETALTDLIAQKLDAADFTPVELLRMLITVAGRGSELITDAVANQKTGAALKIWQGTEAEYNAIPAKDANTLYIVQ